MRQRQSERGGFTLIELLVVIAIITILAAIVLPVFHAAQARARMTQCLSNLSSIATAMKMYRNDAKRYPPGALGNLDGLLDNAGNAAYTAAKYNTTDTVTGRKTRISALYPSYLEDQKSLICPDEDGDSYLISGKDESLGNCLNGQTSEAALSVGADGSVSSYDDFYNVFGYSDTGSLGAGTPITSLAAQVGGGRKAPRLTNPFAPGNTIITYCRKHEGNYTGNSAVSLVVRVDAKVEKVVRAQYSWSTQAEQAYN